nr:acetyl-CoA carboxylase, carboxyltransferase subunit beta [Tissierella sp.]
MLKDFFNRKKYAEISVEEKIDTKNVAERAEVKEKLADTSHDKLKDSRMGARERIRDIIDEETFIEYDKGIKTINPLEFPDYQEKIAKAQENSGETEAVITGEGDIDGKRSVICVMNPKFMMGSMGSVVGEKITRAIEKAEEKRLPIIIFTASGGARMQEGILSLMQMAKTSAALGRLKEKKLPYIAVLTDPTTGGVTASFAMLGDIIISEPNTLICFAGPRVIEQTIKQSLPEGFQRAEFLLKKGFIDMIVDRGDLKAMLAHILTLHPIGGEIHD